MGSNLFSEIGNYLQECDYAVQMDKNVSGYPVDIYAENKKIKKKCLIECKYGSPILSTTMMGFSKLKKNKNFVAVISPKGASYTAQKIANDNKISIYLNFEDFKIAIQEYTNREE